MLATAKNYDILCLQMRNCMSQQDSHVKKETTRFISEVKAILTGGSPVKPRLDKFIPQIFDFRILALNWLANQPDLDLHTLLETAAPSIELLQRNPKLALLGENMMFAMRCNMRVVSAMFSRDELTSGQIAGQLSATQMISYEQFLDTLAISIPDITIVQTIADWLHASLYIEFILLAGILIDEENIPLSDSTISELSFLIADAAQEYYAIATQMGILPRLSKASSSDAFTHAPFYEEDQILSDLGLSDFALNF